MALHQIPTPSPTARVGWNNRLQTVTMPLEYRFPDSVREVFICREGESVVLTPRPNDWSGFFASGMKASSDFMADWVGATPNWTKENTQEFSVPVSVGDKVKRSGLGTDLEKVGAIEHYPNVSVLNVG